MSTRLGGRYQLVRELGAGGMGRVFQAVDTETGRAVAAKIMIGSDDNLEALLRFQQEGAVLSTLKHPNIVEVYGTFLEEHTSCIIMELLEGRSLGQLLKSDGRFPLPRVKHLMHQVASALAYAHGRAIVHRDIKPDNIMVVGDDHVKVTDFGIARILRTGATLNTATGMSIGTPLYMAPEQIEGQKVDGRADLYSFGAVMYQMVTGHPPFEGEDPLTIAFKHVHKAPQPPREVNADVPEDWEVLILKALAKDPSDRFQTAAALEEAVATLGTTEVAPAIEPDAKPDTVQHIITPELGAATLPGGTRPSTPAPEPRTVVPPPEQPAAYAPPVQPETRTPPPTHADQPPSTVVHPSQPAGGDGRTVVRPQEPAPPSDLGATILGPTAGAGTLGETRVHPQPFEQQPAPYTVPTPTPAPTPQPYIQPPPRPQPYVQPVPRPEEKKRSVLPFAIGGAVALVAIVAGVIFALTRSSSVTTTTAVPSLIASGTTDVASGQNANFQWSQVPKATNYHLQVATWPTDPSDAVVFAHPLKTVTTPNTFYSMTVVGRQFYYWRVASEVDGKWSAYSQSQHFLVPKPSIKTPVLRLPKNGTSVIFKRMTLCWSSVKGALSYVLKVNGKSQTVHGTCTSLSVTPGTYHWSVAARFKGARVYTGSFSAKFSFTIRKQVVKKKVVKPTPVPTTAPATSAPTTPPATPVPTTPPVQPTPVPTTPPAPTSPPPTSAPAPTKGQTCNPC